jgi:hypothetical protein
MFKIVPPDMQTEQMKIPCSKIRGTPVFRLRRPLYGWSRSGNIWEHHLADTLKQIKPDGKKR